MDITETNDSRTNDLHLHTVMSAESLYHAKIDIREAILRRIVDTMVHELLPVMRSSVVIDWTHIARGIEDALIARMADVLANTREAR